MEWTHVYANGRKMTWLSDTATERSPFRHQQLFGSRRFFGQIAECHGHFLEDLIATLGAVA